MPRLVIALSLLVCSLGVAKKPLRAPADVPELLSIARQYLGAEKAFEERRVEVQVREVLEQWQRLHLVRTGFEKLERRGELRHLGEGRRVLLRHALAQILGGSVVEVDHERASDEFLAAREQRQHDLRALAEVARRAFDFEAPPG